MAAKMIRKEAAQENRIEHTVATTVKMANTNEVVFARCECCGLTEECTEAYVSKIRERNEGRWICGLCSEAVKDEIARSDRQIGGEEALNRHMSFCRKFNSQSPPPKPTEELISAVKQLLLRSLDSPRSSPVRNQGLLRSQSFRLSKDKF